MASVGLSPVGQNSAALLIILCVLLLAGVPIGLARFGLKYRYWASYLIHYVTIFETAPSDCDRHSPKSPLLLCSFEDTQCINHFLDFKIAMHN